MTGPRLVWISNTPPGIPSGTKIPVPTTHLTSSQYRRPKAKELFRGQQKRPWVPKHKNKTAKLELIEIS
jgi:hypothetical protein